MYRLNTFWTTTLLAGVLLPFGMPTAQEAPVVVERESAEQVRAGDRYEYELTVTNRSEVPVTDVVIREFRPDGKGPPPSSGSEGRAATSRGDQGGAAGTAGAQADDQAQAEPEAQSSARAKEGEAKEQGAEAPQSSEAGPGDEQGGQAAAGAQAPSAQTGTGDGLMHKTIPYLEPGESRTLNVSGVAREEGTLKSCMAIDYTPAVCSEIDVVKPDVALECQLSPARRQVPEAENADVAMYYACEPVQVACRVTNQGSGPTREAQLMLDAPQGITFDEGSARTTVDPIAPGEQRTFEWEMLAEDANRYSLTPRLKTDAGTAEARSIAFRVVRPQLDLAVQAPSREYVNRPVNYTVHLRNTGDVTVPETTLAIDPPEVLENISVSSEVGAQTNGGYEFGPLKPGDNRMLNVQGDAVSPGEVRLAARASGYCVDEMNRVATVPVQGVPALVLVAFDENDPVAVGEETRYQIKVTNQGTAPAKDIQLNAELGEQFRFVEGVGTSEVSGDEGALEIAPLEQLAPGESAAWTIVAEAKSSGYARLNIDMESSATQRAVTEQEPTRVIE
jgi:uncharacterized repeat protein (TIGR01451 family)